ncbi:hypothetical protein Sru01_11560 [Sphaerisporangium rufum]|uniref:Uncharacterized protein n=1 Tax=Sphaerisporangium rufum TaxID=1381558 RepID=A0A919QY14_9ACTN|nr:hypothetical protein [Sphaerisporangium rufum]GII76174.1 hypothetical protein Sru01_11560 [Sphaerisporangium rufum]
MVIVQDRVTEQGRHVVAMFEACAAAPDDLGAAAAADEALRVLEAMLVAQPDPRAAAAG